jgi:hypothetical protein
MRGSSSSPTTNMNRITPTCARIPRYGAAEAGSR